MTLHSSEPQVSVRNIPQSTYNNEVSDANGTSDGGAPGAAGGKGIKGHLQKNWPLYALGLGAATIVVMLYLGNRNASTTASSDLQSTSDTGATGVGSNQLYGSQLEADNQEMMSLQNTTVAQLNQLLGNSNNYNAMTGTVRNSTVDNTGTFDKKFMGIPVRSGAGITGSILRWIPFGSSVQYSGPAVTGQNNFGVNNAGGSNLWEPLVGGGYVSAYDLTAPHLVGQ